jgi:hypothetical protein
VIVVLSRDAKMLSVPSILPSTSGIRKQVGGVIVGLVETQRCWLAVPWTLPYMSGIRKQVGGVIVVLSRDTKMLASSSLQCCGTVTIYYGSGSGSGSDF